MSKIILPNGNGTGPRSLKRSSDFVTMDELVQLLGPQATMLVELHHRLEELEAQHGIFPTYRTDDTYSCMFEGNPCLRAGCTVDQPCLQHWNEPLGPNLSGDMD